MIEIPVEWKTGWLKDSWDASRCEDPGVFSFWKFNVSRVPRNVTDAQQRFDKHLFRTGFRQWWTSVCGGLGQPPDKLFILNCRREGWDIPWELMLGSLLNSKQRAKAAIVRSNSSSIALGPYRFDSPLRILMIHGEAIGGSHGKIALDREKTRILEAWESLEATVKNCVEKPVVAPARRDTLATLLKEHRPHLLWFSGHGRSLPQTGLLFQSINAGSHGEWVDASELARLIRESNHQLLYAVFLACSTGRKSENSAATFPALFDELSALKILSMMVMQEPIGDAAAIWLASELFRHLASGLPLEIATARCRAGLFEQRISIEDVDWAVPVVWSTAKVASKIEWGTNIQEPARLQIAGTKLLRLINEVVPPFPNDYGPDAAAKANIWNLLPKVWVHNQARIEDSVSLGVQIAATLHQLQYTTNRFVITVTMKDTDVANGLASWAEDVYAQLIPRDLPDEVTEALVYLKDNQPYGWQKLCNLRNMCLAILDPPKRAREIEWFWRPLLSVGNSSSVVICSSSLPEQKTEGWTVDTLVEPSTDPTAMNLLSSRSAQVLAVLNQPIPKHCWESQIDDTDLSNRPGLLLQTFPGPILSASARNAALTQMTIEDKVNAHFACLEILSNPDLPPKSIWCEERLKHLLHAKQHLEAMKVEAGSGQWPSPESLSADALKEASLLCCGYYEEDRPHAILDVFIQLGSLGKRLKPKAMLRVAWAYLRIGKTGYAELFLAQCQIDDDPLEAAWQHALLAEIHKTQAEDANRNKAIDEINEAIKLSEAAVKMASERTDKIFAVKRLLAYRQDRARIFQYLFYQKKEASDEYESILRQFSQNDGLSYEIATINRNYSECLRSLSENNSDPKWMKAKALLNSSWEILKENYPHSSLLAEVCYEFARIYEGEEQFAEAKAWLTRSVEVAIKGDNFMMVAIGRSRLFWKDAENQLSDELIEKWREIDAALVSFPRHGWAVRVLIDGRLRIARYYESADNIPEAFKTLENVKDILDSHPAFREGSDQKRIARTYAGLEIVGAKVGKPHAFWTNFVENMGWAQDWMRLNGVGNPEAVWNGGSRG